MAVDIPRPTKNTYYGTVNIGPISTSNTQWKTVGHTMAGINFDLDSVEVKAGDREDQPLNRRVGQDLPKFLNKHLFVRADLNNEDYQDGLSKSGMSDEDIIKRQPWDETSLKKANLVTSVVKSTKGKTVETHRLLLDLDFDAALIPSSTPGHNHLYIDKELTKEQVDKVVAVLNEVGILQDGVKNGYNRRGALSLRLPWIDKDRYEDNYFDHAEYEKREKLRQKAAEFDQAKKDTLAQLAALSR